MRDLGGRPHWAKNFETAGREIERMYGGAGGDLGAWRRVRDRADPEGMFAGPWHRRHVLGAENPLLPLEELEVKREREFATGAVSVSGDYGPIPDRPSRLDRVNEKVGDWVMEKLNEAT